MHLDVLGLRRFYFETPLGDMVQRVLCAHLMRLWPPQETVGKRVAGFGFAVPLLCPYLARAKSVIALMPAQQGVMPWPPGAPNLTVLCEEMLWPLQAGQVDRLVLLHGLETSEYPVTLLAECARVLAPGGKAMVVVPNRLGLWARRDATPFGVGRPYSFSHLDVQIAQAGFRAGAHLNALFAPPSSRRLWLRGAAWIECAGMRLQPVAVGGVIMLEISGQPHALPRPNLAERIKRPLRVLEPTGPGAKPAIRTPSRGAQPAMGPRGHPHRAP